MVIFETVKLNLVKNEGYACTEPSIVISYYIVLYCC